MDYLPNVVALRATELSAQGRTLHNLVAGGCAKATSGVPTWTPLELNGYVEFRQPASGDMGNGRLFARLSRLSMLQSEATQVETCWPSNRASLPAVDMVVDDFELRGRKLGRIGDRSPEPQRRRGPAGMAPGQVQHHHPRGQPDRHGQLGFAEPCLGRG